MDSSGSPASGAATRPIEVDDVTDGVRLVSLRLSLDAAGVDRVESAFLAAVTRADGRAAVDFSGVPFIASLGLRMLISASRAAKGNGARFVLYGLQQPVGTVIAHAALDSIVTITTDKDSAIALLSA